MVRAGPEGLEVVFREGARTLEWTKAKGVGPYGLEVHLWAAPGIVPLAEELADRGVQVVLAGLDLDFRGEPFGPVPELLARAEEVPRGPLRGGYGGGARLPPHGSPPEGGQTQGPGGSRFVGRVRLLAHRLLTWLDRAGEKPCFDLKGHDC